MLIHGPHWGFDRVVSLSRILSAAALLSVLLAPSARAQETMAPSIAVPLLLKVLTYDQNFQSKTDEAFVVLVASEPGQAQARRELMDALTRLSVSSIRKHKLKFVEAEFQDAGALQQKLLSEKASALLAVPGLSEKGVKSLSQAAQAGKVYSLALSPEPVEQGVMLGVGVQDGRPQLQLSAAALSQAGVALDPNVLKRAKVMP